MNHLDPLFERVRLTRKERAVALHLIEGKTCPEIAALENNSPKTIRQHISTIYGKLSVANRAEFFRMMYGGNHFAS